MKNKKELLKIQDRTIESLNKTVAARDNEIGRLSKDLSILNTLHSINETALHSAESALEYKELRENDNAEFMAKVITGIIYDLTT